MAQANGQDVSQDELINEERRSTEHSTALGAAQSGVGQGFDPGELGSKEFVDTAAELDVDRDDLAKDNPYYHDIEGFLAAESSKQLELSNITRRHEHRERIMDRARAILAKMEMPRPAGAGSKCQGETRRRMTGEDKDRPVLTADLDRQIDAGYKAVSMKRAKSVNGWFLSKIADMTVLTRSEGFEADSDDGGWLSKATGVLRS